MKFAFILMFASLGSFSMATPRIINGIPVETGEYPEVTTIRYGNAMCNATKVGPRTYLTAGHCSGSEEAFIQVGVREINALSIRHPSYPEVDIALAVTDEVITSIAPVSIIGSAWTGIPIVLVGSGCTTPGGGGGNDGVFRKGEAVVTGMQDSFIVSQGAALCFGDSGGPAFAEFNGTKALLGIAAMGDIMKTNYHTNLQDPSVKNFLAEVAAEQNVEICGINANCI